jgi:hypothetical protein
MTSAPTTIVQIIGAEFQFLVGRGFRSVVEDEDTVLYERDDDVFVHAGFTPPPPSATVPAGQSLHGTPTFDVPRGGGEVQYNDGTNNPRPGWPTSS